MATEAPAAPAASPAASAPSAPAPAPASAAPAPASAPASSSPPPSGAGNDPLEDLRRETIAWGHEGHDDFRRDGSSAASSTPTSEPAAGSTPEAPGQTAAEGSTPPGQGQPAPTDAPTSSAHQDWIKRYGDPEKAAKEAFALEQRAADMAKRIKELEAGQTPPATPTSAPTTPATAAAPSAAPATSPAQPAQPAQPAAAPAASIEDQALEAALKEDECRALIDQHTTNEKRLEALTKEITDLETSIRNSNVLIDHPSVDELAKDEARQEIQRNTLTLRAREAEHETLKLRNDRLDVKFRQRVGTHASRLQEQAAIRAREAEHVRDAERQADEFVQRWPSTFEAEFQAQAQALNIDPKLIDAETRKDIHEAVKTAALARPGRIDINELGNFMKEAIRGEFVKFDRFHRQQARHYALRKNADTDPNAPTGPEATATQPPASPSADDSLTSLRNETRAAFRARGAR